jgi:hypothetical protein
MYPSKAIYLHKAVVYMTQEYNFSNIYISY